MRPDSRRKERKCRIRRLVCFVNDHRDVLSGYGDHQGSERRMVVLLMPYVAADLASEWKSDLQRVEETIHLSKLIFAALQTLYVDSHQYQAGNGHEDGREML